MENPQVDLSMEEADGAFVDSYPVGLHVPPYDTMHHIGH